MIDFLEELTKQLRLITQESYYDKNPQNPVVYPYLTFDFDTESLGRNRDGFYLDLDIFDYNSSYKALIELEDQIKDALIFNRVLTPELNMVFSFQGSNKIPTGEEMLKRRNLRFYIRTDWRVKEYGTT